MLRMWEANWAAPVAHFHMWCVLAVLLQHRRPLMTAASTPDGILKYCIQVSAHPPRCLCAHLPTLASYTHPYDCSLIRLSPPPSCMPLCSTQSPTPTTFSSTASRYCTASSSQGPPPPPFLAPVRCRSCRHRWHFQVLCPADPDVSQRALHDCCSASFFESSFH